MCAQGFEIKNSLGNVPRLSYFRLIYGSLVLKRAQFVSRICAYPGHCDRELTQNGGRYVTIENRIRPCCRGALGFGLCLERDSNPRSDQRI
jgi:hypothetical protein